MEKKKYGKCVEVQVLKHGVFSLNTNTVLLEGVEYVALIDKNLVVKRKGLNLHYWLNLTCD